MTIDPPLFSLVILAATLAIALLLAAVAKAFQSTWLENLLRVALVAAAAVAAYVLCTRYL